MLMAGEPDAVANAMSIPAKERHVVVIVDIGDLRTRSRTAARSLCAAAAASSLPVASKLGSLRCLVQGIRILVTGSAKPLVSTAAHRCSPALLRGVRAVERELSATQQQR